MTISSRLQVLKRSIRLGVELEYSCRVKSASHVFIGNTACHTGSTFSDGSLSQNRGARAIYFTVLWAFARCSPRYLSRRSRVCTAYTFCVYLPPRPQDYPPRCGKLSSEASPRRLCQGRGENDYRGPGGLPVRLGQSQL